MIFYFLYIVIICRRYKVNGKEDEMHHNLMKYSIYYGYRDVNNHMCFIAIVKPAIAQT